MSASGLARATSDSRTSSKNLLQPSFMPIPPSPPASDPIAPPSSSPRSPQSQPRVLGSKTSKKRLPPRFLDHSQFLKAVLESEPSELTKSPPTCLKRRRSSIQDQLGTSSPPTSPTTRQSSRPAKRLKVSSSPIPNSSSLLALNHQDSPTNPFLVKPGEPKRRAGAKTDESHRKLVYVFRGKRIAYDTSQDLSCAGGSPFATTAPKLLFPSPPSPTPEPTRKLLKFEAADQRPGSHHDDLHASPQRDSARPQLTFQTPKRDHSTSNVAIAHHMLPTPQSNSKKANSARSTRIVPAGPINTTKTMARIMR